MKITKTQLKRLIKEELENTLEEEPIDMSEGFDPETGMPTDRESLHKFIRQAIQPDLKVIYNIIKKIAE